VAEFTNPRAVHFPPNDETGQPDAWHVQSGEYPDDPDLNIVIEHAVDAEGKDARAAVAAQIVRMLAHLTDEEADR
jgi:geranylgeranyl pyrophosphate synthase